MVSFPAVRLTDLVEDAPGQLLMTAAALRGATGPERVRWTAMRTVELGPGSWGRAEMTQLARPV